MPKGGNGNGNGGGNGNGNGGGNSGGNTGATGEFVVTGQNFLSGGSVQPDPHAGNESAGQVNISGGEQPFEDDDIIVFVATDVSANGSITSSSEITEIIVYDSYDDYLAGEVMYTYESNSPNGAQISNSLQSLGDSYVGFNGNSFSSDDPDAPDLGQVFIGAGVDLGVAADGGTVTIDHVTDHDYDGDGQIDPGTEEEGDGNFSDENNGLIVCFAAGTRIETPFGLAPIERLEVGDLVMTMDNGPMPIRWIGTRKVPGRGRFAPVLIRAGALGNDRDLRVSPNHRMLVTGMLAELMFGAEEVLVPAKHLINHQTILPAPCAWVTYVHFLLDGHQIVWGNGCASESLYPGQMAQDALGADAQAEVLALFPELAAPWPGQWQTLARPEPQGSVAPVLTRAG